MVWSKERICHMTSQCKSGIEEISQLLWYTNSKAIQGCCSYWSRTKGWWAYCADPYTCSCPVHPLLHGNEYAGPCTFYCSLRCPVGKNYAQKTASIYLYCAYFFKACFVLIRDHLLFLFSSSVEGGVIALNSPVIGCGRPHHQPNRLWSSMLFMH